MKRSIMLFALAAAMFAADLDLFAQPFRSPAVRLPPPRIRPKAVDFPQEFKQLNNHQPLQIHGNLKGHVIILDFWTYCCINCIHILPDLEYLEHKYKGQPLVVIGVHSAKFETEEDPENIRQAVQRYRIEHPVIVDEKHTIWNNFNATAWPSYAVIDSAGRVAGITSGEGKRELLEAVVEQLFEEGRAEGTLADKQIELKPTLLQEFDSVLAFPGKITADPAGKRLIIADSNHDRLLVTDMAGKVQHVIGTGKRGFKDGSLSEAEFYDPQGVAIDGNIIYLADTKNHSIRRIDLDAGKVTTIAGTGKQVYDRIGGGTGTEQGLASPWDVVVDKERNRLIIAMAGPHQLWQHDLSTGVSRVFAGSGRENIVDGPAPQAQLAQPSGLWIYKEHVYFADSEVSAVRRAKLVDGEVDTLIGHGLFEFGHKDGEWSTALLQHCLGVAELDGKIYVADTYNNALRRIDLQSKTIETVYGGPDSKDLDEPAGLTVADGKIYIADTNHHRIVRFDPATGKGEVVEIVLK